MDNDIAEQLEDARRHMLALGINEPISVLMTYATLRALAGEQTVMPVDLIDSEGRIHWNGFILTIVKDP